MPLILKERIYDYSSANEIWWQISECDSTDWSYYSKRFGGTFHSLKVDFLNLVGFLPVYTRRETVAAPLIPPKKEASLQCDNSEHLGGSTSLETIKVLQRDGVSGLSSMGVKIRRHSLFHNLVELRADKRAPELIRSECRGLILDELNSWKPVSIQMAQPSSVADKLAIDWNNAKVFELLDGHKATVYFYGGSWQVASVGKCANSLKGLKFHLMARKRSAGKRLNRLYGLQSCFGKYGTRWATSTQRTLPCKIL